MASGTSHWCSKCSREWAVCYCTKRLLDDGTIAPAAPPIYGQIYARLSAAPRMPWRQDGTGPWKVLGCDGDRVLTAADHDSDGVAAAAFAAHASVDVPWLVDEVARLASLLRRTRPEHFAEECPTCGRDGEPERCATLALQREIDAALGVERG